MSKAKPHQWTEEEYAYLKEVVPGHTRIEILALMNERFDNQFTLGQVVGAMKRRKLKNGFSGRFEKGYTSTLKGTKGVLKAHSGSFQKGKSPINRRPVGSERFNTYGYCEIKVAEPNVWRHKHRVIWEQHHGPLPKGHMVIFANGDRTDISIENLILVDRKTLITMNREKLIMPDAELTKAGVTIAKVISKTYDLSKQTS